jgi:hypothetical protein
MTEPDQEKTPPVGHPTRAGSVSDEQVSPGKDSRRGNEHVALFQGASGRLALRGVGPMDAPLSDGEPPHKHHISFTAPFPSRRPSDVPGTLPTVHTVATPAGDRRGVEAATSMRDAPISDGVTRSSRGVPTIATFTLLW